MKSTVPTSFYFSKTTASAEKKAPVAEQNNRSPYLKAILSGASRLIQSGRVLSMINPDRDAAIRYIKESSFLRK
jgi:hypothetical protein